MLLKLSILVTSALALPQAAVPSAATAATAPAPTPTVVLSQGAYRGNSKNGINSFLGIPFARAPVGPLRFALPLPPFDSDSTVVINATAVGPSCPQMQLYSANVPPAAISVIDTIQAMPQYAPLTSDAEDCLSINIQYSSVQSKNLLPVVVWIFGGGFEFGSNNADGSPIVARSVVTGAPIIYVAINYRVGGFGFSASKEIKAAGVGNLGLQDQRQALRWVKKNIAAFGGDPSKVTIWGESAGAISVASQMITNKGNSEGLFRGGFMNSGSPLTTGSILNGQFYYDQAVNATGCQGAVDTLACLRLAPYSVLKDTFNQQPGVLSYQALRNAYLPRTDGTFFTDDGPKLVASGQYSRIPIVTGDCADEGTLFSLFSANITTDKDALAYIQNNYLLGSNSTEIAQLAHYYPRDPTVGSPFGTGYRNQLSPQFKRISAFTGDYVFQGPRRYFLSFLASTQPTWTFIYNRLKQTPFLGSAHSLDTAEEFFLAQTGGVDYEFIDYLCNFVNTLNPNTNPNFVNPAIINWPQFSVANPQQLQFLDKVAQTGSIMSGAVLGLNIGLDSYRAAAMNYLTYLSLKYPM